jgi:surface antigen
VGSGGQVKRIEGAGAVTASEYNMCGKVAYSETQGSNSIEHWLSLVKRRTERRG